MSATFFVLLFTLLLTSLIAQANNKPISDAEWRQDIDELQLQLETRHINLYHNISKQELSNQLAHIKNELPKWTTPELMVQLMRTIKQVGDGHTQFNYWGSTHHRYPLRIKQVGDQLRVVEISDAHKHLLGMRLHSINGAPSNQLMQALKPILQGVENEFSEQQRLADTLIIAEVLEGLRITKPGLQGRFTFVDDQQKLQTITLKADDSKSLISLPRNLPAGFTPHKYSSDELELLINPLLQTIYLDFKKYPRFQEMISFADKLADVIKDQNIKRVIIDLRHNGGGDFFVGLALARGLIVVDSLDWNKGIYVLIGRKTFSASMSNAAQYRQILNATLVGEPTGSDPVGYQDADTFVLPNSGWKVMYSKRLYRFQDEANEGVQPDVILPEDWNALVQGKDNQLQWILNNIQQ